MNIKIRGDQMLVTESLREYVERKISKLERYFEAPLNSDVQVTLNVIRDLHTVEVTIPLTGMILRAEERSEDMYASIDMVLDKLERQIRKYKTKANRRFRHEGGVRTIFKENFESSADGYYDEDEDDIELVRTKRFALKPMDVEEAILQMNLLGHNFFVFSNSDTNDVSVVYMRDDGKYGLIEPAR